MKVPFSNGKRWENVEWIGVVGKIETGKPHDLFHGKIGLVSGENVPKKTNPIKNGMEKIEKVYESGKRLGEKRGDYPYN